MISLSYADAFFLYLLFWMLLLGFLTWREHLRTKNHHRRIFKSSVFHCSKCNHTFVADSPVNLHRCPSCNAICIRHRRRDSA